MSRHPEGTASALHPLTPTVRSPDGTPDDEDPLSLPSRRTPAVSPSPLDRLLPLLACPECRKALDPRGSALHCPACDHEYPVRNGVPILHAKTSLSVAEDGDAYFSRTDTREEVARRNRLVALFRFPNPAIRSDHPRKTKAIFANEVLSGGKTVLNVGSGVHKLYANPNLVNLDIAPHGNVDVVGDGLAMPFLDDRFDGAVLDAVLEHVPDPWRLAAEAFRVLKPGGFVLVHAPFLYPYHGAPRDYFRYTDEGLRRVFADFDEIECDSDRLPGRALQEILRAYAGIYSDRRSLSYLYRFGAAWLSLPYKLLDVYLKRKRKSSVVVTGFSYLGRKPHPK